MKKSDRRVASEVNRLSHQRCLVVVGALVRHDGQLCEAPLINHVEHTNQAFVLQVLDLFSLVKVIPARKNQTARWEPYPR